MDEPAAEQIKKTTVIVQALCNIYGRSSSTFSLRHYHVNPNPESTPVRGIRPESLSELPPHRVLDEEIRDEKLSKSYDPRDDIKRIRRIQALMDYRLEEIDGSTSAPSGAIKIAELLGVDDELLHEMKAAWQEEEWQN